MEYNFTEVEKKWQKYWAENKTFRADNPFPNGEGKGGAAKPKYYVLDMFPYPSGAGLHVGHPLGYIASDIYARFKRLKGFNVLHPMGYDSFGLPAEQYAIQTGQHPNITTKNNIARYREQLDKIGFSFDWEREVRTSDPEYYKWTQWIFIKLFNSWYNPETNKAESIDSLISKLETGVKVLPNGEDLGGAWNTLNEKERSDYLMQFRLAYLSETYVNWCPQLGTVLANEEVKDGVSERGGYPVERKLMPQWSLRITAYADRLLNDLEKVDWSESIKEAQRNWIGKSEGSSLKFEVCSLKLQDTTSNYKPQTSNFFLEVFTTRPDTVFGVSFLTLAPEHELIEKITQPDYKQKVEEYITYAKNRSERERMTDVKKITGQFTGAYAVHPFSGNQIPIWIGEYVLAGYGTGAVMGVPAHDSRDYAFAKHFELPILEVVTGGDLSKESYDAKEGKLVNSDFLNGLEVKDAIKKTIAEIEKKNLGKGKTNYRLRDAIFGRQRYWGEPIPIYYKDNIPHTLDESELPLVLPEVDKYLPTESGEPPLARAASSWKYKGEFEYEKTTMPGWAGSSWYYLRYMDTHNKKEFASKEALNYWKEVDLYIGGSEHATGHLLYVRFWTKFLNDLGYISITEPAKKLINQGMIQGISSFVYRINETNKFVSLNLRGQYETTALHVDVNIVSNDELDINAFKKWRDEYSNAEFILEDGKYICGSEVAKMSKRWHNVVNPDDICKKFGADCLRMYEMFLGPLEQSKPWNTNGIAGVSNFIRKLWRLYHAGNKVLPNGEDLGGAFAVSDAEPTKEELKILHKTIKKVQEDIEKFSFNTSVSSFMICVNELTDLKCNKRAILEPLAIILSPYAPHVAEELWSLLGHKETITYATSPDWKEEFIKDDSFEYPVSVNGKTRFKITMPLNFSKEEIESQVMTSDEMKKYLNGNQPKKIIVVPGRIVNVVL